jgi:alpha-L-fucosidase
MTKKRIFVPCLIGAVLFALALLSAAAQNPAASPAGLSAAERLAWWKEARFGLFIHWGPVSLKGTEISWSRANTNPLCPNKGPIPAEEYDNLYKRFNPTQFNAAEWAGIAKTAGTRYVVLTAKHCDGFCLWPTKTISYHIGNTPFKRDVCGELAAAVRAAGLRIGWYYSPMDWWDPDCRTAKNADYIKRMQGQIRELVTRMGRIDVMWFDWDGMTIPWDQAETYRIVRTAQPGIIINNRLECSETGNHADKFTGPNADYLTPEQEIGAYNDKQPWETCMTLGTQWSWKPNDDIKSADEVVRILARCAGGDGNLLLNVGPMPDGRIEPRQVEVLKKVGDWMAANGESIYGTRGGPFKPGAYGASTRKGNTIYLHVFQWTGDKLLLPALPAKVLSGRVMGGGPARVRQTEKGLEITVAEKDRRTADTVVVLDLDGPAGRLPAVDMPQSVVKTPAK